MAELKPPVIVVGNYRSGTTMLYNLLGAHPDLEKWFEPRTIWQYADPTRKHDRFTEEDARPGVKRYIRRRFLQRQRQFGGRRIVEKTPTNVLRMRYVHEIFPESKIVYIVRDPFASIASADKHGTRRPTNFRRARARLRECPKTQIHCYAGNFLKQHFNRRVLGKRVFGIWGVRYPGAQEEFGRFSHAEFIARQWAECARIASEDVAYLRERSPGTVIELRYEEFVADPVRQFPCVLEANDLEMTPELEAHVSASVDSGRQTKWKKFDQGALEKAVSIVEEEMTRHGYRVPDELRQGTG